MRAGYMNCVSGRGQPTVGSAPVLRLGATLTILRVVESGFGPQ